MEIQFVVKFVVVFLVLQSLHCGGGEAQIPQRAPLPPSTPRLSQALIDEPVFAGQAYVIEAGPEQAPWVVLLHGIGDSGARDWNELIPELAKNYRVLAFDLPGFGRSSRENERYTPDSYVRFVKWLVTERVEGPFYLVGHSMGATLAMLYAATHPEDLKKLVIADAAGILEHHSLVDFWGNERSLFFKRASRRSGDVLGWANNFLLNIGDEEKLRFFIETHAAREKHLDGNPTRIAGLAMILKNFGPAVEKITTPTLIIWGGEDIVAPMRVAQVLSRNIPAANLEVIPGVGHVPMIERPVLFSEMVLDFLGSTSESDLEPPVEKPRNDSARKGRCDGRRDMILTGDYAEIEISGCERAKLRDVRASKLTITRSTVIIEASEIAGAPVGLDVSNSEVLVTNTLLGGDVAIKTKGSVLDIAGGKIEWKKEAVAVAGASQLVFSVCQAKSPDTTWYLHGLHSLQVGESL